MAKVLARFWLLRFAQVAVLAGAVLGSMELLQRGPRGGDWSAVLEWAVASAALTASVSAWWAYKRQCRLVFKPSASESSPDRR